MRIATRTERGGARATLVALVAVVLLALGIMVAPQQALAQDSEESVAMYRLYNPLSGEHFYTSSESERDTCVAVGWSYEGVGWYAPATSSSPVYRLYNPYSGDHHYTMSASERDMLVALGWRDEGTGWYSSDARTVSLYRQFNPYETIGTHNYTKSKDENDYLASIGWNAEGVAWYGVRHGFPSRATGKTPPSRSGCLTSSTCPTTRQRPSTGHSSMSSQRSQMTGTKKVLWPTGQYNGSTPRTTRKPLTTSAYIT